MSVGDKLFKPKRQRVERNIPELAFDPAVAKKGLTGSLTYYDPVKHPYLVYSMCKLGSIDTELADALCVSMSTVQEWKKKYAEFRDAIILGKDEFDSEKIEASLRKRALGYEYDKKTIKQTYIYQKVAGPDGKPVKIKVPAEEVTLERMHVVPDSVAIIFFLKNRAPKRWQDVKKIDNKHLHAFLPTTVGIKDGIEQDMTEEELNVALKMIGMDGREEQQIIDVTPSEGNGDGKEKNQNNAGS